MTDGSEHQSGPEPSVVVVAVVEVVVVVVAVVAVAAAVGAVEVVFAARSVLAIALV